MDIRSIIAPEISDFKALEEFIEALYNHAPDIERDISRLKLLPDNREIVGSLFRTLHSIKGDATLCHIELAVAIIHPIETLLSRLRNDEIQFSDTLAEAILLAIDRLELAVEGLRSHRPLENLRLLALVQGLEKVAGAPPAELETRVTELVEAVTGFRTTAKPAPGLNREQASSSIDQQTSRVSEDLRFFRTLAEQLEARSPLFKGRTLRLLRLAAETNLLRDKTIDPIQLEAAIYMHDIGMMFLPESIWLKIGRVTPEEKRALRNHPEYASGILSRMESWQEAADIVAQHHETPDGQGYPIGLSADRIHDGAKLLAIIDAFEAVMLKHAHRGKNRSVLRAIAEINACNNQFFPEWIEPFNKVIRRLVN